MATSPSRRTRLGSTSTLCMASWPMNHTGRRGSSATGLNALSSTPSTSASTRPASRSGTCASLPITRPTPTSPTSLCMPITVVRGWRRCSCAARWPIRSYRACANGRCTLTTHSRYTIVSDSGCRPRPAITWSIGCPMNDKPLWIGSIDHERLGPIWVALSPAGLVAVLMKATEEAMRQHLAPAAAQVDQQRTQPVLVQIVEYLEGRRRDFDIEIDWSALSPFQASVLRLVRAIPYGQTRTYGDIAGELGQPGGARAVGRAIATNPMPLVIPCHRVLGTDGRLHGYGGPGGVVTKAWLLQLEGS